jgi:hypothetical protein
MIIWRDEDDFALRRMAPDGLALAAYALGRKPSDVLARADVLGVRFPDDWRKDPSEGATAPLEDITGREYERMLLELHGGIVCPRCGKGAVLPWTRSGSAHGVCPVCYHKAAAITAADAAREAEARLEHDAARKRAQRAKTKARKLTARRPL